VVIGHCTDEHLSQVFRVLATLGWLCPATLHRIWHQGGVALAEFRELNSVLVAEMIGVKATLARDASHITLVVATHNVLFVAGMAVPVEVGTDLVVPVSDTQAACSLHGHVGAFSRSRLQAAVLANF
jgi:hypothetical protein